MMKTKLLRKLRREAKNMYYLLQTGDYHYEIRSSESYLPLSYIGGTPPLGSSLDLLCECRRNYILRKVKEMRGIKYPRKIDI